MNLRDRHAHKPFRLPVGSEQGFGLMEIIVVVAAMVLIAAILVPTVFSWVEEGKIAKAQGDASAMAAAMSRFFQDTGRWPGQAEILKSGSSVRFLIVGSPAKAGFPSLDGFTGLGATTCTSGLLGVSPNATTFEAAVPTASNTRDITDFLIRKPAESDYPNWRGPYLSAEIRSDPWDRAWLINVIPLFCGETISSSASGAAGYGWILSGGSNQALQTSFTATKLNPDADDVGVSLGKLTTGKKS